MANLQSGVAPSIGGSRSEGWEELLGLSLAEFAGTDGSQATSTDRLMEGERREVAVLFLDLHGFTQMSEKLDHEMVHRMASGIMSALAEIVRSHGGYVDKFEGDRIMALFGARRAFENDCVRAVSCGLRMLDAVRRASRIVSAGGMKLQARVGVSYGAATVAPDPSGHLTAMGDEVNVASRMESSADLGTVRATERVMSECRELFEWEDLGPVRVKGKSEPLHVYRPIGPGSEQRARWERRRLLAVPPLSGREDQMRALEDIWASFGKEGQINRRGGASHLAVEVVGEAGMGKTRLIHEFRGKRNKDLLVLQGSARSYSQPPNWIWSSLLRRFVGCESEGPCGRSSFEEAMDGLQHGHGENDLTASLWFLADLLQVDMGEKAGEELGDEARHDATLVAVRDFVQAAARRQGRTVIVLENVQWMDAASVEALVFLLENCDLEKPLLVLLLGRPSGSDSPLSSVHDGYVCKNRIDLTPLDENAVAAMTRAMLRGRCDRKLLDHVRSHTGGNPFFVEELVTDLVERGAIQQGDSTWKLNLGDRELRVPSTVSGLLRSRMDRLSMDDKIVLQCASAVGCELSERLLADVARRLGLSMNLDAILEALLDGGFLQAAPGGQHGVLVFGHKLIRAACYSTILHHNRKLMHRATAQAMERIYSGSIETMAGEVSTHWEHAGETGKAIEYAMMALRFCRSVYQNEEGLRWAERIEGLLESEPSENCRDDALRELLSVKQSILGLLGSNLERSVVLDRMIGLATFNGDDRLLAVALTEKGFLLSNLGSLEDGLEMLEDAVERARMAGDELVESRALRRLAMLNRSRGQLDKALELLQRSLAIATDKKDLMLETKGLASLGIVRYDQGMTERARELFERSLELSRRMGDRKEVSYALSRLAVLEMDVGELKKAQGILEDALSVSRDTGDRGGEGSDLANLANLSYRMGKLEKAREYYTRALEIHREVGSRRSEAIALGNLALVCVESGRIEEGIELYERAIEINREIGNRKSLGIVLGNLAQHYLDAGRTDEAAEALEEALKLNREVGDRRNQGLTLAVMARYQNLEGRLEEAAATYGRALDIHREVGDRVNECTTLSALGQVHLAAGFTGEAVRCYGEAASLVDGREVRANDTEELLSLRSELIDRGVAERSLRLPDCLEGESS
jgi:class 3 adenylate cyclase/tetratricopeptide (TPR) repeat protein